MEQYTVILLLWLAFFGSHLGMALYIMKNDLSGAWDQFRLAPLDTKVPRIKKYMLCMPTLIRDVFVILPLILMYVTHLNLDDLTRERALWEWPFELFVKLPLAYTLGRIWAMLIHRGFHSHPWIFKVIHKEHHVRLTELCAFVAWRDSVWEFLLMEIPGAFTLGPCVFRLHWSVYALFLIYHGTTSAIDHSGFDANWIVDSKYHFVHHKQRNTNFAEMDILDRVAGTYTEFNREVHVSNSARQISTRTTQVLTSPNYGNDSIQHKYFFMHNGHMAEQHASATQRCTRAISSAG